ncbi:hypothetical protein [Puniceicoccus vermicola]|uniref:Uncharacterized protein n=1 Tax=Puniceicoccus vermicola TaxID=388746 RepID=A0A7X1AWA4_9BACT|nr:hypothetical protein [Puniceicoccus vermicola]MBC2601156.1 hypothetical protein [Puniceicoccus vermicola]
MAGLQLLSETWKHGKIREHYTSTELNLVLKDGRRIGLVDDHRTSELNQEAKLLAEFLQVPLWNNSFF